MKQIWTNNEIGDARWILEQDEQGKIYSTNNAETRRSLAYEDNNNTLPFGTPDEHLQTLLDYPIPAEIAVPITAMEFNYDADFSDDAHAQIWAQYCEQFGINY